MKERISKALGFGVFRHRIKKYPGAFFSSIVLTIFVSLFIFYFIGQTYPDLKIFDKLLAKAGFKHDMQYTFYSGPPGGMYGTIGKVIDNTRLEDGDIIKNQTSQGGYYNAGKISVEGNIFGLVQQDMINLNDPRFKNAHNLFPIFPERLHIFIKKSILPPGTVPADIQLSANN